MNWTQRGGPAGEGLAGDRVSDLLDDPIVQLVMRRDGVTREEVLSVVAAMRGRLSEGQPAIRLAA